MEQTIKVADKPTLDAMQREIAQMQSLLGTLGEGIAEVASAIAAVKADVANVKSAVGTVNNTVNTVNTNTSNIKSVVDALKAAGSSSVKSVQYGLYEGNSNTDSKVTIYFSPVSNLSKTVMLANGFAMGYDSTQSPCITNRTNNSMTVLLYGKNTSIAKFNWTVIEFN